MSDGYSTPLTPEEVTIERWQYDNPSWLVITNHQVLATSPEGDVREEIEIKVAHRETGAVFSATGGNAVMALAMIDYLITERL